MKSSWESSLSGRSVVLNTPVWGGVLSSIKGVHSPSEGIRPYLEMGLDNGRPRVI